MNRRTSVQLAWSLWAVSLVLLVAGGVMALAGSLPPGQAVIGVILTAFQLTSATVGALIVARHPTNAIGWLFLAAALSWGFSGLGTGVASLAAGEVIPITEWVRVGDWLAAWIVVPAIYIPVIFLFLLFPDGHLPSPRWRWVAVIPVAAVALITVEGALGPGDPTVTQYGVILKTNPYAVGDPAIWVLLASIAWFPAILGTAGSAIALFARFRRSSGEERERMKLLAYAAVVVGALFLLAAAGFWISDAIGADPIFAMAVLPGIILSGLLIIPVATGIAILRHRLFDVDLVINRTVVYGLLAAFVTLVYVGIVVGIGAVIGSRGNVFLSIVATALIALAFQPMRERARRLANRLVYGKRATPYEVMSEFADRVAGTYSLDDVLPRMARIAAEGTGAERVEVWIRVGGELRMESSWPAGEVAWSLGLTGRTELPPIPDVDRIIPVTQQDEILGAISVTMPRTEALTAAGEKLLADLASQAGLVLRNVRLIEELRASRQRLVAAQDEERRRLERNLHDGAQQQLVALSVKMRLLKVLARKDPEKTDELVDQLQADSQDALDNLRDLARGIYPPLLADRGLAAALDAQARKAAMPVDIEPDGIGRYDQEAEATAYFCVLEAIQNVAKYAGASRVVVQLAEADGHLTFTVADDGQGFDVQATPKGSGLQNMADRLDALRGTLTVESTPGRGTTITGRLPVAES